MKNKVLSFVLSVFTLLGVSASAATSLSALYSFPASGSNGIAPTGQLLLGNDGYLYGTAKTGGAYVDSTGVGCGTIYKVNPTNGTFTLLVSFTGTNGSRPDGDLVWGPDNNLHGVTKSGGKYDCGTIFVCTTNGTITSLYSFRYLPSAGIIDGNSPSSGVVEGVDSNYYGVTPAGGAANAGRIYQFTSGNVMHTLYDFSGLGVFGVSADGQNPDARLYVLTNNSTFLGITHSGGTNDTYNRGDGVFFVINSAGQFTNLYDLVGTNTGFRPVGQLMHGLDGALYGVTSAGSSNGFGGIIKINTNTWAVTSLVAFNDTNTAYPTSGLTQHTNGLMYGVANGFSNYGNVYVSSTNAGAATNVLVFATTNGANPSSTLTWDGNLTNFYGTATGGGTGSNGVIFQLNP